MIRKISKKREKWGTLAQYKKICAEIWGERDGKCEKCGLVLGEPRYHHFNHTKGRRHNLLNKETIELVCMKCHSKHHGINTKNSEWLDI